MPDINENQRKIKNIALIVAGGVGLRVGGEIPKQYLRIGGDYILRKTINAFAAIDEIDEIAVVIGSGHEKLYSKATEGLKILPFIIGGKTRQESVFNGLKFIKKFQPQNVLIHDAARPFVSKEIILASLRDLNSGEKAVIPVVAVKDTSKIIENNYVKETIERSKLYAVQTPQSFEYKLIHSLHDKYQGQNYTDDSALCEEDGIRVKAIDGDYINIKITTNQDLKMVNVELGQKQTLIGSGFDVHAFEKGDEVIICGAKIPFNKKLKGHSDADVGWHALTDAILGAIGLGDIGEHFSDKDLKWENANSIEFLKYAVSEVKQAGGVINNADITIICEAPKLFEYKQIMRGKTAEVLNIPIERVNIKATTTEKMGFLGREEGIAANAVCTVSI